MMTITRQIYLYSWQKWSRTASKAFLLFLGVMILAPYQTLLVGKGLSYLSNGRFFSATALSLDNRHRIAVIGGGASGIFAAIAASEHDHTQVTVLEATGQTLQKVKISGGGRCNVLHDTSKAIPTLLSGYPRGRKELNGLFHKRFTPAMARDWFEHRGVELKTEADGRMFPVTDSSQTIMDVLIQTATDQGVQIQQKHKVVSIQPSSTTTTSSSYVVELKDGSHQEYESIILATGSSPSGYALVRSLEQPMESPVPSLFTLNAKTMVKDESGLLHGLSGVSVPSARVSLSKKQFQEGPLLITHHGLSGPAVLRLSAFAAHEFKDQNYRGDVTVNWDTELGSNAEIIFDHLWEITASNPKRTVASACPLPNHSIPRRLWAALVRQSGFAPDTVWGSVPKKMVRTLANHVVACPIHVTGKGTFKDEFVTAGGVSLKGLDMKTMQSKRYPGLFFCGELINIDGVTGGFNFMNCWSTGYVAGHSAADLLNTQVTMSVDAT